MTPAMLLAMANAHHDAIEAAYYGDSAALDESIDCAEIRTAVCDIWIAETENRHAVSVEWCNRISAAAVLEIL